MFEDDVYTLYDSDGNVVLNIDNRIVTTCSQQKIVEIKQACQKAIEETGLAWMVEREVSGGKPVSEEIKQQCAAYRNKSDLLEQQVLDLAASAVSDTDTEICDRIQNIIW